VPGFTIGNLGNQNLKPERTNEVEVGFEAALFQTWRISTSRTTTSPRGRADRGRARARSRRSDDAIREPRRVSNKGVEIAASVTPVRRPNLEINVNASAWATATASRSSVRASPRFIFGLGGASQRHQPGYALGSYFMTPYTWRDANSDGIVDTSE